MQIRQNKSISHKLKDRLADGRRPCRRHRTRTMRQLKTPKTVNREKSPGINFVGEKSGIRQILLKVVPREWPNKHPDKQV